jgi:hypothetical protein
MRFLAVILFALPGLAQVSTSRLEAWVLDPVERGVPAAAIAAVHDTTGLTYRAVTDSKGFFALVSLPPGKYTITVEADGFRKLTSAAVDVGVASTTALTFDLQLGSITEVMTVRAKNSGIQAGDSQLSRAITMHDVEMLPQLERYPITLSHCFSPAFRLRAEMW